MIVRSIFFDLHEDLRIVWKVLLFIVASSFVFLGLTAMVLFLGIQSPFVAYGVFVAAVGVTTYAMVRLFHRKPFRAIGLIIYSRTLREFGIGVLLGFLMMSGIYVVLASLGYADTTVRNSSPGDFFATAGSALAFFAVAAFAEELLFRGYLFQVLIQGVTLLPAIGVMSLFFAVSHSPNPSIDVFPFINIGLAGVWLSFAYVRTRGLWLPLGLHLSWNLSQSTIFGFATSGIEFSQFALTSTALSGPEWLSGGGFGPEGGILATVALIACTWYVLKARYLEAPEGIITLDSLEDLLPVRKDTEGSPEKGAE